ncbi:hypothetical protein [Coraliomargarita parva]|uniref:hypothetical protein n=1 Tax=Coraliomargarita parva TaxID=3014050 RepID=UPI0022B40963|nr:hypothetical protein [Coraliomargarita parva]
MAKPDPIDQLNALNELLAQLGQKDPEFAEHAKRALLFYRQEQTGGPDSESLQRYVERLANLYLGEAGERELALEHWHVPAMEDFSPLWIRQAIVSRMKALAGQRQALLLVTGLHEAVCPPGRRWTANRTEEYRRVRNWIDELACAWASKGAQLQVIVL